MAGSDSKWGLASDRHAERKAEFAHEILSGDRKAETLSGMGRA